MSSFHYSSGSDRQTVGLCLLITILLFIIGGFVYSHIPGLPCTPTKREIAITIDDLPLIDETNQHFVRIVQSLIDNKVPAIGFVIAKNVDAKQLNILKQFKEKGFLIGNHSYSHTSLAKTTLDFYIEDIAHADKILAPLMTTKYYRYPYLAQGKWQTKEKVHEYLASKDYTIAPITIDTRDFVLNTEFLNSKKLDNPHYITQIKQRYLNFVWKQTVRTERSQRCQTSKQILLMHANILNSYFLDDLLKMYTRNGYRFISLTEALKPLPT